MYYEDNFKKYPRTDNSNSWNSLIDSIFPDYLPVSDLPDKIREDSYFYFPADKNRKYILGVTLERMKNYHLENDIDNGDFDFEKAPVGVSCDDPNFCVSGNY